MSIEIMIKVAENVSAPNVPVNVIELHSPVNRGLNIGLNLWKPKEPYVLWFHNSKSCGKKREKEKRVDGKKTGIPLI